MTQIYNTFSGELLRWPDNSFFIPFKFLNVWLFLNLIKPFIRWDKTVFSSYFDTECIHWIDLIRNVFLTKKFYLSGSNLHFGISDPLLVMSFTGTLLQNTASLRRSSLKNQEIWRNLLWDLSKETEEHRQIDSAALWKHLRLHCFCTWNNLTVLWTGPIERENNLIKCIFNIRKQDSGLWNISVRTVCSDYSLREGGAWVIELDWKLVAMYSGFEGVFLISSQNIVFWAFAPSAFHVPFLCPERGAGVHLCPDTCSLSFLFYTVDLNVGKCGAGRGFQDPVKSIPLSLPGSCIAFPFQLLSVLPNFSPSVRSRRH